MFTIRTLGGVALFLFGTTSTFVGGCNCPSRAAKTHDVVEVSSGRLLTASQPIQFLDVRENRHRPELLAVGTNDDRWMHTARWPRQGEGQVHPHDVRDERHGPL